MLIYFAVLSKNMGSDCTPSALDNRFRSIKKDAKAINSAVANGIDVLTLHIGVDGPKCRLKLLFSSTLHTACFRIFKHISLSRPPKLGSISNSGRDGKILYGRHETTCYANAFLPQHQS